MLSPMRCCCCCCFGFSQLYTYIHCDIIFANEMLRDTTLALSLDCAFCCASACFFFSRPPLLPLFRIEMILFLFENKNFSFRYLFNINRTQMQLNNFVALCAQVPLRNFLSITRYVCLFLKIIHISSVRFMKSSKATRNHNEVRECRYSNKRTHLTLYYTKKIHTYV